MKRTPPPTRLPGGRASNPRESITSEFNPLARAALTSKASTMPGSMDLTGDFSEDSPFNTTAGGIGNLGPESTRSNPIPEEGEEDIADDRDVSDSIHTRIYATPSDTGRINTTKITLKHIPGDTGDTTRILRAIDEKEQEDGDNTPSAETIKRERRQGRSWPEVKDNEDKDNVDEEDPVPLENIGARKGKEKEEIPEREPTRITAKKNVKIDGIDDPTWTDQTIADWNTVSGIYKDEKRLKKLEAYNMSKTIEMVGQAAGQKEIDRKKKARISLGVNVNELESGKARKTSEQLNPAEKKGKVQGLPSRGYLADALNSTKGKGRGANSPGDPDSSSSSSSSSSSDSSDESSDDNMTPGERRAYMRGKKAREHRRHKETRKLEKLKLSGYKTKLPTVYNGESNYDLYEQFVYEVNTWVQDTGFNDREAVKHIKGFLKEKAAVFYMNLVAPNPRAYNMRRLWTDLFEYCFPPDVKARLRRKFYQIHQSDRGFKDFVRELQKYQRRLSDVSDRQVAQRMWEGAHAYLRVEWAKAGMNAEDNSVEELEETGVRFEVAERIRRNEENKRNERTYPKVGAKPEYKKEWKAQGADVEGKRDWKGKEYAPRPNHQNKKEYKGKSPRLTKEQMDEYRAKGKCFICAEVGHITKDCPKRNTARPTLTSSSIDFAKMERAVNKSRTMEIHNIDMCAHTTNGSKTRNRTLEVNAIKKHKTNETMEIERNSATPKDLERRIIPTIVVEILVNGNRARALLDSGSVGDFMSSTLVDQLKLQKTVLAKPINLSMAVAGSKGVIKYGAKARIEYQTINEEHYFDVVNLERYDLILGTSFLYKHGITLSFNPVGVHVKYAKSQPITGKVATKISSCAADLVEVNMERIRDMLVRESEDVCKKASETPLPPLRVINHRIPIIDSTKNYSWRSSRCPDALREQWETKLSAYIATKRWIYTTGRNAIPMLLIPKKGSGGISLRTVLDKREQNANTHKVASPLPDIQEILWKVSQYKYKTLIDGTDAYEQIRVEPEDVPKTIFTTPSGTMVSQVMQQGDCNAGATYQSLMNSIFSRGIGVYMHVFLDDIVIFTNTIEGHIRRIREVLDVLRKEKLYLSPKKMQFFAKELHILGHIIDDEGILMDPHKVDSVKSWKTPNSKEQLMSFLGAVGYLAPNCDGIRIPMGVLTQRAAINKNWNWDATAQRAFDEVKGTVQKWRDHHRVAIDYTEGAPKINITTDASCTGASGILSQGEDHKTAKIAMFWSAKFTATQQNYPVHELELLAIKESMRKFQYQLHGIRFRVYTDNKSLEHLLTQKSLSARQARWLDFINQFDFEIVHIPGVENQVADALSRIYAEEPKGIRRADSEYMPTEEGEERVSMASVEYENRAPITVPLYVGNAVVPNEEDESLSRVSRSAKDKDNKEFDQNVTITRDDDQLEEGVTERDKGHNPEGPAPRRSNRERAMVKKFSPTMEATHRRKKPKRVDNKPKRKDDYRKSGTKESTLDAGLRKAEEPTEASEGKNIQRDDASEIAKETIRDRDIWEANPTFLDEIKGKYENDNLMSKIVKNPSHYKGFEVIDDLVYLSGRSGRSICVPNTKIGRFSARELAIREAHELLRHASQRKTLYALRGKAWWSSISKDVSDYCASCVVCATSKSSNQSSLGLLKALKPASKPWERMGIDFLGPIPESENINGKWDMICVAIDHATSMVRLIPSKSTFKAKDIAELLFENVYKLHGIPRVIVSDRDSLFTSTFWQETHRLMGVQLRFSSAYHPETDGATEKANKTMSSMIRQSIQGKQTSWAKALPGIEYAMNASRSETTGFSPFELNYGRIPPPITWGSDSEYAGVRKFLIRQKESIVSAHDARIAARVRQTEQANKHRREASFEIGDLVYLSTKNMRLPKKFARKLVPKYIGPHKIESEVTKGSAYKVDLPADLKARGVHPVFHASLLRPHIANDDRRFPGRASEQVIIGIKDESREWLVERVLEHAGRGRDAKFKLKWASGDTTWEEFDNIRHLEALDTYLEAQGVSDAAELEWTKIEKEEESEGEEDENREESTAMTVNAIELYDTIAKERAKGNKENRYIVPALYSEQHSSFNSSPFHYQFNFTLRRTSVSPACYSITITMWKWIANDLFMNDSLASEFTEAEIERCGEYRTASWHFDLSLGP